MKAYIFVHPECSMVQTEREIISMMVKEWQRSRLLPLLSDAEAHCQPEDGYVNNLSRYTLKRTEESDEYDPKGKSDRG